MKDSLVHILKELETFLPEGAVLIRLIENNQLNETTLQTLLEIISDAIEKVSHTTEKEKLIEVQGMLLSLRIKELSEKGEDIRNASDSLQSFL